MNQCLNNMQVDYILGSHRIKLLETSYTNYTLCIGRWKSSIKKVTTIPGADCGTDHNLLIAIVKIKLKKTKRNKTTPKYDLENIVTKYTVEVKNIFSILQVDGKNPEELWIDIRDAVIETAEKWIPKLKKRKVTK